MNDVGSEKKGLAGRVALVVGASRGIGRAIALRLARDGADVAVAARSLPDLETLAEEVRAIGTKPLVVKVDVAQADDIQAMIKKVADTFGHIDILVYCSGTLWAKTILETTDEMWETTMNVNLTGAFRTMREVVTVGKMLERKYGRIIGISSEVGKIGDFALGAYAASKHGMLGLIRSFAMELGPEGIAVNAVCPGMIRTEMGEMVMDEMGDLSGAPKEPEARLNWWKDMDPQKRIAVPEDVADVVSFLAGDDSASMTAQSLSMASKTP